jgi:hypothetical protein
MTSKGILVSLVFFFLFLFLSSFFLTIDLFKCSCIRSVQSSTGSRGGAGRQQKVRSIISLIRTKTTFPGVKEKKSGKPIILAWLENLLSALSGDTKESPAVPRGQGHTGYGICNFDLICYRPFWFPCFLSVNSYETYGNLWQSSQMPLPEASPLAGRRLKAKCMTMTVIDSTYSFLDIFLLFLFPLPSLASVKVSLPPFRSLPLFSLLGSHVVFKLNLK